MICPLVAALDAAQHSERLGLKAKAPK